MKTYNIFWREYAILWRDMGVTPVTAKSRKKAEMKFLRENPLCKILNVERVA